MNNGEQMNTTQRELVRLLQCRRTRFSGCHPPAAEALGADAETAFDATREKGRLPKGAAAGGITLRSGARLTSGGPATAPTSLITMWGSVFLVPEFRPLIQRSG
jgi:hypothetical protein